jgi:hypothetical protein
MGTVVLFKTSGRTKTDEPSYAGDCEIVIFPGVRIERSGNSDGPDARRRSTGRGKLDGTNGRRRPRKTS